MKGFETDVFKSKLKWVLDMCSHFIFHIVKGKNARKILLRLFFLRKALEQGFKVLNPSPLRKYLHCGYYIKTFILQFWQGKFTHLPFYKQD